jgi:regulator of replication initiation timing
MARMTNAQLVEENIALRHNNEILRTQLADVNAQLAALSAKHTTPERYVTSYTKRDGTRWAVYQTAPNRRVHRPIAA